MKQDTTMNDAIRGTPPPTAAQPERLKDVPAMNAAMNAAIRRLAGRPVDDTKKEQVK